MATGVDLIGKKIYTANVFPNVEGLCAVAELDVRTVEEGDTMWGVS
jgi:hypothetical protein